MADKEKIIVNLTTQEKIPIKLLHNGDNTYTPSNKDWFQSVAEGLVPGYSYIEKFGQNPDIDTTTDPEDVWDAGGLYTFSTTANITKIASSDNSDTQDVLIIGLDTNWEEVSQTVTLTGQTPATLTTPLIRVYRMVNVDSSDIAGTVNLCIDTTVFTAGVPGLATDIRAQINNGNNQTLMCIYTIPAGKTGYFLGGYVSLAKTGNKSSQFTWRARPFGSVFQVKSTVAVIGAGNSSWLYKYPIPVGLPEKTDVIIRCESVDANDTSVSGGFSVLLKDN